MHSGLNPAHYYVNGTYHSLSGFHDQTNGTNAIELALSVIVLLGGSLSLVGLAFAFITYSLFSDSSDFGGTTLMNLLASLFLGQLLHVIGNGDPSLFHDESSCLTLAFIEHYMWLSKFFWLLALVRDVHHRLNIQGLSQVSSKKIQLTEMQPSNSVASFSSQTLLGSYTSSIYRVSMVFWGTPLLLTIAGFILQTMDPDVGVSSSKQCWLLSPVTLLPVLILAVMTSVTILQTMSLSRGARNLLLTNHQFSYVNRCLSLSLKLLPLLLVTLSLGVAGKLLPSARSDAAWSAFHVIYSINGLFIACLLTCDCKMVRSFANVSTYFRQRHRNIRYGTGEIVSANDLNMLVFCKDDSNVV